MSPLLWTSYILYYSFGVCMNLTVLKLLFWFLLFSLSNLFNSYPCCFSYICVIASKCICHIYLCIPL